MSTQAVTVSLETLKDGSISSSTLMEAFGPQSLGILIVKDIPGEFVELRHRLLTFSCYLANLPKQHLDELECPEADYLTGWSKGKEVLKDGRIDTLKGSFYVNCSSHQKKYFDQIQNTINFPQENFPEYLNPNVWPSCSILPGFKETFEAICHIIVDTAVWVARACDRFAEKTISDYKSGYLEEVIKSSTTTKARLLYYYPTEKNCTEEIKSDQDDWCATHVDHGCLTGLISAMYIDETLQTPRIFNKPNSSISPPLLDELSECPDFTAGLYILSRSGENVHIKIPRDCIAFQTGEALERVTHGQLKAVPHYVKAIQNDISDRRVARSTLAVFTQPNLEDIVDFEKGIKFGDFARDIVKRNIVP